MFSRSTKVGLICAIAVLTGTTASAQRGVRPPVVRPRVATPRVQPAPRAKIAPAQRANVPLAGQTGELPRNWVEQLREMPPGDQQRFLKNNERFKSLPPGQQDLIRNRLKAWNKLPPEQRQELLERQQIWEQLPPGQRQQVRQSLLPRWQSLPVSRRQIIMGKLRELRAMDAEQRTAKLNDEGFLSTLNPDERQMLRELSTLGVGDAAG